MRPSWGSGERVPSRDDLVDAIVAFLAGEDLLALDDIRIALEREIDHAGPDALLTLKANLTADLGWDYYPRDPLAQRIHHLLADRFLTADSQAVGVQHLAAVADAPTIIFSNHLSYADANVIEVLLQRCGGATLANRLIAIAGPKVFTSRERRFSSLCFGTIKVPQSTEVASEEAVLSARDVAIAARRSIDVARAKVAAGGALLLFGEGTRSRTGAMQPMLAGVARYLGVPGTWILPAALAGSEALFPVGASTIQPARVVLQFGQPFPADALMTCSGRDRRTAVDAIALAIAECLPPLHRGAYAPTGDFADARDALCRARANDISAV